MWSPLLGLYVIYMFNYFRTTINFQNTSNASLQPILNNDLLAHSLDDQYGSKICPLGQIYGWVYGLFLIFRDHLFQDKVKHTLSGVALTLLLAGGLTLNLNVVMYLLPVIAAELTRYCNYRYHF